MQDSLGMQDSAVVTQPLSLCEVDMAVARGSLLSLCWGSLGVSMLLVRDSGGMVLGWREWGDQGLGDSLEVDA